MKEKDAVLFSVTAASTIIIFFLFFNFYSWLNYFDLVPMFPNKYYVVAIICILGLVNYKIFISKKKFLSFGFKKDAKGGITIISLLVFLLVIVIFQANLNRTKLLEQNTEIPTVKNHKQN